jgi:hypothetical protein
MESNRRGITLALSAIGGLALAAFLPMAVALADDFDFTPDQTNFDPTQIVVGYPPLLTVVDGTESWNILDTTTNTVEFPDDFQGVDNETTIGSFTNNDIITTSGFTLINPNTGVSFAAPVGTEVDLANFGGGFENEWIDIPSGPDSGVSDLLITPLGDLQLLGTGFADLANVFS